MIIDFENTRKPTPKGCHVLQKKFHDILRGLKFFTFEPATASPLLRQNPHDNHHPDTSQQG